MGAYTKNRLRKDFEIASKGISLMCNLQIEIIAANILDNAPDNTARDMAISHLLGAVEMISSAYLIRNQKIHPTEKSG